MQTLRAAKLPFALSLALLLALCAAAARAAPKAAVPPAATAPGCTAAVHAPQYAVGESYKYKLDLLGAEVGTFEISVEPPPAAARDKVSVVLRSRAHTNAFVSTNVTRYEAFAETQLAPDLSPLRYTEETDEGDKHRSQAVSFPPVGDKLAVHTTLNGKAEDLSLGASRSARDMLSAWLVIRGTPLAVGSPFCTEVYAAKKMWKVTGTAAAKERIDTPLGSFQTVRIDTVATRVDDPKVVRNGHFWVTDDARRLPVAAIAEVRGNTLRAQLTGMVNPHAPPAAPPKKTRHEEVSSGSGSAGIGRR